MSGAASPEAALKPVLLCTTGLLVGAAVLSSLATQFVAYRVGYHPAIGAPTATCMPSARKIRALSEIFNTMALAGISVKRTCA